MDPGTAIAVATLATKVLSIIWKYGSEVKNARASIMLLADEIHGFREVMQKVQDLLSKSSRISIPASLEKTIKQALLELQSLEGQLDSVEGSKRMRLFGKRALKWPLTKKEVDERVARFQRMKATINLALNTDSTSLIIDVDSTVTGIKEKQMAVEQEQQLGKLPFAGNASFDSYHRQHESSCMANTRVELLQRLQDWGTDHQRPIFWLSGMAGTGKSTISRTLANRFKHDKILGGNFFFSRASGEANNAANLVGTLARQLANTSPALKQSICEAISLNQDVVRQGLRNQWKELIFAPLSKAGIHGRPNINLVIDALDECSSDDDIRIILQLFVEVKIMTTVDLGVFITSRPEVVIRLGFDAMPGIIHQRLDLRDIPRPIVEHDICVLLESEFDRIRREHKLHDWPSESDRRSLVQRSECLFIYAKTACRYIGDFAWDPEERLAEILHEGSTGVAATAGLDAMYMQVLKSALTLGQNEAEASALCIRFRHVVGAIVTIFDELSIPALGELLSMTPRSVDAALSRLHSVLDLSPDGQSPIRLLHPSFHDFLIDGRRCKDERFCVNKTLAHGELVSVCLETMSAALNRNMCRLPTPGSSPQDVDSGALDTNLPKHVRYACEYWVDHLMTARSNTTAQHWLSDSEKVHSFFRKDFLHWLEAMSLMRKMPRALGEHVSLLALVQDARRFVLRNSAIIEEAPLQTYASALVFSPAESLIRESYSHQLPTWLTRLPEADSAWGNCVQNLSSNDEFSSIAFSPNGKFLVCVVNPRFPDETSVIQLWDVVTGTLYSTLDGDQSSISDVVFLHNGNLASLSSDNILQVWEPITGLNTLIFDVGVYTIDDRHEFFWARRRILSLSDGDLAILCPDHTIRIWSLTKQSFSEPVTQDLRVTSLFGCLSYGRFVFSSFEFGQQFELRLFDPSKSSVRLLVSQTDTYGDPSKLVAATLDDKVAWASPKMAGIIWLLDTAIGALSRLGKHSSGVRVLEFCPDGTRLISGGDDRTLISWDLLSQAHSVIGTCLESPFSIAISPDGKRMATMNIEQTTVQLWDLLFESRQYTPGIKPRPLSAPHETFGAITTSDGSESPPTMEVRDIVNNQLAFICGCVSAHGIKVLPPTGGRQAATSAYGSVSLQQPFEKTDSRSLSSGVVHPHILAFSSDGKLLASGSRNGHIQIWNSKTTCLQSTWAHGSRISRITFSPDCTRLASLGEFSARRSSPVTMRLWEVNTGQILYDTDCFDLGGVAISADNKYIAFPAQRGGISVYDTVKKERHDLSTGNVEDLAFSDDSKALALCSERDIDVVQYDRVFPINVYIGPVVRCNNGSYMDTAQGRIWISHANTTRWDRNDDRWITERGRKMLWLPPEYDIWCMARHNDFFAIGHRDGVRFLEFTHDDVLLDTD
ncbi:MAG: hypothetical protein Q9218_004999 [Villophora microphyllina]